MSVFQIIRVAKYDLVSLTCVFLTNTPIAKEFLEGGVFFSYLGHKIPKYVSVRRIFQTII